MGLISDWTYLFLGLLVASIFLGDEFLRNRRDNRRWREEA